MIERLVFVALRTQPMPDRFLKMAAVFRSSIEYGKVLFVRVDGQLKDTKLSILGARMGAISQHRSITFFSALLLTLTGLAGCGSAPQQSDTMPPAMTTETAKSHPGHHRGLTIARGMLGMPYRYGGASPDGFDCSGLVYYSYRKAGIHAPRTTTEQYRQSRRVQVSRLQPGDLLFFTISQDKLSHVGIYAGNGRFIHAPSSGKAVSYASIQNPYWRGRLIGAGRLQ